MKISLLLACITIGLTSFAESDTAYTYLDSAWKETKKESAIYISKIFKQDKLWCQHDVFANTGNLQMEGFYTDRSLKKRTGTWTWFNSEGITTQKTIYEKDKRKEHFLFYSNGKRYVHAVWSDEGEITATGWDENDNEIPGFIFEQEATFPWGLEAWKNFLVRGIKNNPPADYQNGKISGTVVVSFKIDKQGNVTDVSVYRSSGYTQLDEHAVNIIRSSPTWVPAVQYNKKVLFRQLQSISYQLIE